ncbi:MAG: bifunctional oligoribonuclease/PAP phosphatase NrnA [Ignavibacteriaceae bacterium]|nr:bifunctional oligoribonuclease/PAP phosphatase NrnA [Ignavibacteriaceae bacterium]
MIDFKLLKKIISDNSSFLITTHVNPDADAIGSEIALYIILKELGKEAHIVNYSETPYNLIFLDKPKAIETYNEDKHIPLIHTVDVIIAVDFNKSDRAVKMKSVINDSSALKICIDHHLDPEKFADHYFIDTIYSATGEIIYDFIKKTNIIKLTYDLAYPLYAAIMTDTGSFRFERTTEGLHLIAAEMLKLGVVPGEVFDKIYDQCKLSKFKLLGLSLNTLKLFGDNNNVGYMILTQKDFQDTDALESDTDGFVNFALSVENVKIGIIFVELMDGFKVSFRSKGNVSVNNLAKEYGGGGHTNAAGARFPEHNLEELLPEILNKASEYANKEG